ncbi:hypothetical protein PINS_up005651 [Pythium insidiosum]|nr:hypothetical protein PINS_up005651 [Pythium insidiosum]
MCQATPHDRFKQLDRHRRQRAPTLEPFGTLTFSRVVLTLVTYGLFLSDTLRTGLGIQRLPLTSQDPDIHVLFGPYNYSIAHLTPANASLPKATRRFWTYKYDTTSLAMRAAAKALRLPSWSPCLLYETTCDESRGLPGTVVFRMIDELIDGVRHQASAAQIAWRIEYHFRDRLNEAILPSVFFRLRKRTCQASFYSVPRLQRVAVCDPRDVHPFSCTDSVTNFRRLCSASKKCDSTVAQHITRRVRTLQRAYPNATTLEMVVLDSVEDFSRGGFVSHGRHSVDVVTMIRLRQCGAQSCSTVAVDEYRYEVGVLAASEREWFPIIALLRATGQAYAWLRVAALVVAIVAVEHSSSASASTSFVRRMQSTLRTFLIIPSHIVVYGSIVPVICYAAAHVLDSNIVYELVRKDFNAVTGLFQMDFAKFIAVATVSMRTVWVLALLCHGVTWLVTQRSWSPALGVPGVPELFIAFVSSSTVMAHYRIVGWRDCRVTQILEITPSLRLRELRAHSIDMGRGAINQLVLGTTSDAQFMSLALAAVAVISVIGWIAQRSIGSTLRYRLAIVSRTRVPYSVQWLWPSDALVVNWANSIAQPRTGDRELKADAKQKAQTKRASSTVFPVFVQSLRRLPTTTTTTTTAESSLIRDPLLELEHRSHSVLAFLVTLNLTVLSDPLLFLRLRCALSSRLVGVYESHETGKLWLLPLQSSACALDDPLDWDKLRCVAVFTADELSWTDLLHCG